jgi:hypothetical protein
MAFRAFATVRFQGNSESLASYPYDGARSALCKLPAKNLSGGFTL